MCCRCLLSGVSSEYLGMKIFHSPLSCEEVQSTLTRHMNRCLLVEA